MRSVSNDLFRADDSKLQEDGLNLLWVFFGQFITHDLLGVHRRGDNGIFYEILFSKYVILMLYS